MRVAVLSYPMLFQRQGGLQVQVMETVAALRQTHIDAELFDWRFDRLESYDVAHVFSAINGNHRIVEAAREAGLPVVLSSVLHPPTRLQGAVAEFCEKITGRLTGWQVQTSYRQVRTALFKANRVVALGEQEATLLRAGYGVAPHKIAVIPNGISERFFTADPEPFVSRYPDLSRFVLIAGSISAYKNQLGVIEALKGTGITVVLAGTCSDENAPYLKRCLEARDPVVKYIGSIPHADPFLASGYAAATVLVLASAGEVMPLVALEALAAGTPVLLTKHHGCDLRHTPGIMMEVDPQDGAAIRAGILHLMRAAPAPAACSALVRHLAWSNAANQLGRIYADANQMKVFGHQ